ncbi:MAG TPA: hypothetical protein VNO30_34505 [Kofleriaceae bacterium]|nr:hypothetical protein [Kofleriaceae bacterium]
MLRAPSASTRAAAAAALAWIAVAACESRATPTPPLAPTTPTPAPTTPAPAPTTPTPAPTPAAHTAPPGRATLIAARDTGLHEITTDGDDVRRLSATPAQQPRWQIPGQRVVFLTQDAAELRAIDLRTGQEQLVARVRNRIECPNELPPPAGPIRRIALNLHDDDNFFVEPTRACIRLTDLNPRMAGLRLDIRVDLATGQTTEYADFAEHMEHVAQKCQAPRRKAPPCGPATQAFPEMMAPIEHAGPKDFYASAASPSGRWIVLRGNFTPGDTFFDQVVLYDRTTRRTFPLGGELGQKADAWPAPLTAAQLAQDGSALHSLLGPTTYETPVYWLAGPDDRLVFDERLVIPGERIVYVGQLARSF